MSYKLNKQKAFNNRKKKDKFDFKSEPDYKVKGIDFYNRRKYLKELQRTLKEFGKYDSFLLENIRELSAYICTKQDLFEKANWIDRHDDQQARIYSMFLGYGYVNKFLEETGYRQIWDFKEVNWNDVSKFMYDLKENNILNIRKWKWP